MATVVMSPEAANITSAPRRKSGRVSTKPQRFVPAASPAGSAKRKRTAEETDGDIDVDEPSSDEEQTESSEGEPDEEELRERRRKQKKTKTPGKKPAPKKAKTNGATVSLAIRPAASRPKKPRKAPIRKSAIGDDTEGLYGDVFARGNRIDDVAAQWVASFEQHEANAVADIVNFVLRSAGCKIKIDENDIGDPDNAPNRLGEIQDEYQAEDVTEYPLITKARGGAAFRQALHGFFVALIQTIAQTSLLYRNAELIENIQVWISTMSSAPNRPFRHTSTVASLAIISGLSRVASDIVESSAKKIRQSETESKKVRVNKGRVSAVNKEVDELGQKREAVDATITDWFDTVFVHRYRDVDFKIRVECVEALAEWIMIYPDKFFDGAHLRYLGWVLSDISPPTRLEVLKQLQKLFRDQDKLAGLKTFTERFRPRIVEMATRDADSGVRAAAVELLDVLREAGFLEPDDIDSVGKLIFDAEPKVRKAVVGFFAETVTSAYELQVEDMGGEDALEEALPAIEGDDEYSHPRLEWLKLKCLVEQLLAYDVDESELPSQIERLPPSGSELGLVAVGIESRFSLAAQALYDAVPEIREWALLAGYLLYDHSQTIQNGTGEDVEMMLRQNCKLEEREEIVLLDVLNSAVAHRLERLAEAQKDKKKTKAQRQADKEEQAEMAKRLTVLIPQLLKKFGALPEAASLCLRLQRLLNLDVFQELRQDAALVSLLDDINKQFLTHQNAIVLQEAREALLHAQAYEELREITAIKNQVLWDDLVNTFNAVRRGRDLSKRGNLSRNVLTGVSNIVLKMSELARVSNPIALEKITTAPKSKSKKAAVESTPPISSLLQILDRGVPKQNLDPEMDAAEDTLVRHTINFMLPYTLWKVNECRDHIEAGTAIPDDDLTAIAERRDMCVVALMKILESRKGADELRLEVANLLLDVYTSFFMLKNVKASSSKGKKNQSADVNDDWEALCQEVDEPTTKLLLQLLTTAENNLAKRTRKRLEEPDVDDEPIDPDDEPESSDDEDEEIEGRAAEEKLLRSLMAEQKLCELGGRMVRAVLAGILDGKSSGGGNYVRKRLERNKNKLGHDYKEVISFLDAPKERKGKAAKPAKVAKAPAKPSKNTEIVIDDESEEEREEEPIDEDEEMADDQVNGDARGEEEDVTSEPPQEEEVESVLGD
ncbi:STAG-domain-containing protein [Lojkania enalia]|uniref:STAG-domain-containing protein n=1 Tax=Lojkania enalia TaxID=147567 RepID=A0A9P4JZL6_9PLEO|nr:STAG-domain-containing protein [Didymosphaeria enalia]